MNSELKLIYLLVLREKLNLSEIIGKEGWQPIIRDVVAKCALDLMLGTKDATHATKSAHKFIRKFLIIHERKKPKKRCHKNNQ